MLDQMKFMRLLRMQAIEGLVEGAWMLQEFGEAELELWMEHTHDVSIEEFKKPLPPWEFETQVLSTAIDRTLGLFRNAGAVYSMTASDARMVLAGARLVSDSELLAPNDAPGIARMPWSIPTEGNNFSSLFRGRQGVLWKIEKELPALLRLATAASVLLGLPEEEPPPTLHHDNKESPDRPPLGDRAQVVYVWLISLPETEGKTGKEIVQYLIGRGFVADEDYVKGPLKKELVPYGIDNKRPAGYYIPMSERP